MPAPTHIPTREATRLWVEKWAPKHLRLSLPATFEEYWASVDKDVRTQCRKAEKAGFVARWTTTPNQEDIAGVWDSWEGEDKNGRGVNRCVYHFDKDIGWWTTRDCWPFSYYPHTQGYLDMVEVVDDMGNLVAYLELATHDGDTVVFHTLGHKAFLRYGIVKLMFVEAVRGLIARGGKAFYYLKPEYITEFPERGVLVRDLGFRPQGVAC